MKRIIILLLIISCSVISSQAESAPTDQQKRPERVIATLNDIISHFGHHLGQSFAINRDPNTGIIESSEKIVTFSCQKDDASFMEIPESFMADEPLCYQIMHMVPGNPQPFNLKMVTKSMSKNIFLRTKTEQEMWLMCTKNPDNPQLRDVYAITWEEGDFDDVEGTIYMITSLRPDIYEKNIESDSRTFKIEGRVDANITDSLYNIYIADTRDALYALGDDDYVACVPVVNKRFEFQTELDHPCVGRLRCIFPDGSLCSAWIDLDFVPGETYRITVHDGYYDEDRGYEQRVEARFGKSLIRPRNAATPRSEPLPDPLIYDPLKGPDQTMEEWLKTVPAQQMTRIERKAGILETDMDELEGLYVVAGRMIDLSHAGGPRLDLDESFEQIIRLNTKIDAGLQDLIWEEKAAGMPVSGFVDEYKHMVGKYTEQNNALIAMQAVAPGSKKAKKARKLVQDLMEKYMKEMAAKMVEMDIETDKK
ncbi:MAG: hypothetical protein IKX36_10665 [Prevotella sp.]|nr:hypothetical protein [Prevotella sp.]